MVLVEVSFIFINNYDYYDRPKDLYSLSFLNKF